MLPYIRSTRLLKTVSMAGMAVSVSVLLLFLAVAMFGTPKESVYTAIWYTFFVGFPLYGIFYVGLKLQEYLREIEATLLKQQA